MTKCKLGLNIIKNKFYRSHVWCLITIEYNYKTFIGLNTNKVIELEYNRGNSMPFNELKDIIEECGGVERFMLNSIDSKLKAHSGQTEIDVQIKELTNQIVEVDLSDESIRILKKYDSRR